jgi:DNA-binding transcriptional ArsR family regulator
MLRIHFTGADLVRTRLAEGPDPLWETVLSLQILRTRYGSIAFDGWRRRTRDAIRGTALCELVKHFLFPVTPDASYFPDFLTPPEGLLGLTAGIESILATPARRVERELRRLQFRRRPPSWIASLAAGEREPLAELGRALSAYHRTALAPYWDQMRTGAEIDHARRSLLQRTGGIASVLADFSPAMRWQEPVLEVPYPVTKDLHLDGRGLVLIPSYFCWYHPVALADSALPPTIVYPLRPTADLLIRQPGTDPGPSLAKLIGSTRARILALIAHGATTSDIARRADVSLPTASQHAAVLRESGLITSRRHANTVIHTLTPIGAALLNDVPH